jgi:hypothetical protein
MKPARLKRMRTEAVASAARAQPEPVDSAIARSKQKATNTRRAF